MKYWLIKSEPFKYSWEQLKKDKQTFWDGVRNYQARNNLRMMKTGDLALFYHSNEGKCIVGVAQVIKEAYQDPTSDDSRWLAVDIKPVMDFQKPVSLAMMKEEDMLKDMSLIKQGRLSVSDVSEDQYNHILSMSLR